MLRQQLAKTGTRTEDAIGRDVHGNTFVYAAAGSTPSLTALRNQPKKFALQFSWRSINTIPLAYTFHYA
jgi:hypothetical protein